ncbi:MAG: hypothetical protein REI09_13720 [Candidatus Dactylopiibacterium sp.]|nr:hypothetical protein [Candidatus Dactylopiibacterium sp.]
MDPHVLQLVARIKIRLRQEKSIAINTQRFFSDTGYARQVLDAAEECEDVELVSAALELRDRLGWMPPAPPAAATAAQPARPATTEHPGKAARYMFGARS